MPRLTPYLGTALAFFVVGLVLIFSNKLAVIPTPLPPLTASSTDISIVPTITSSPSVFPNRNPQANTTTPTSSTTTISKKQSIKTSTPLPIPKTIPAPPQATSTPTESSSTPPIATLASSGLTTTATEIRTALVNIICYAPAGSGIHSISASGIFIDSKGIILTNAHVAQYFLLADKGVVCDIRTGSPATDAYSAKLLYVSPSWVQANATVLVQTAPSGTGQYDFALLGVTESLTSEALPSTFPSLRLAHAPAPINTPVVIASFGAQFLSPNKIQSDLFPTIVYGSVKNVFTFATDTADVLSLGGSAAAQEGSSGGGVADASGTLVGTITTSTVVGTTATRTLSAITASYIRSEYAQETGDTLDSLLALPIAVSSQNFALKIPALESIITAQLP